VIGPALLVAAVTAGAAIAVVLALRLLPTVRLQLAGLAVACVLLPLAAVLLSGWVMFHMGDDVKILAVVCAAASAAIGAGLWLGRSLGRRIDRLRGAAQAFAAGDLASRTPADGPAELAELSSAFNDMAARLSELFDSRSELTAWASHDLRTPIASLKAMLEALEDGVAEPADYLGAMSRQVETLEAFADDLFDVARIDARALTLDARPTELSELVREWVDAVRPEAAAAAVRLEAKTNGPAVALCDAEKIQRVLRNLLANALRHTPRRGSITVSVATSNGRVRVAVDDTGTGLDPEALSRMFDRFWRGDSSRSRGTGGAGLGLTIARGLIEAHGGEIWAQPRDGGGATVAFSLPRV
jgi:two-component system sensor histidine kinase BaeS